MKKIYQNLLSVSVAKTVLLSVFLPGAFYASNAQVYRANQLLGSIEAPPNNSPGTGSAVVTIVGTTMHVKATFSGLTGPTTVCHIHAATAVPGTGTAGVATTTPTFPGFPAGVTSGTYDMTFDMTLASSYNTSYRNNNGGTPASAFAALKAALNDGKAYFNIHSSAFPGGEIRGFLVACPTISVSIPDAFALARGVLPNTVYPAYSPAASLTLATTVSGGTGPYTYNWSDGSAASTVTVSPLATTLYSVIVQDQNGCTGTASKTVNVTDISGGRKGDKILICHKGNNTLTIAANGVADHLEHGDLLGTCADPAKSIALRKIVLEEHTGNLSVRALPNPSWNYFDLQIGSRIGNGVQVRVYDLAGRLIESKSSLQANQTLRLGTFYSPGIYLVEVIQGGQKQIVKLLKGK